MLKSQMLFKLNRIMVKRGWMGGGGGTEILETGNLGKRLEGRERDET